MFFITEEAKKYILKTGKDIVITFTFEPSGGGCSCVEIEFGEPTCRLLS